MLLNCQVQQYAWGKFGNESSVARLKRAADPTFTVDNSKNYAELWMGTHPTCPSTIVDSNNTLLSAYLQQHEADVGVVPAGYNNNELAFLFKILSIRTALSIQAHPDKELAKTLFQKFPLVYKDGNHKPEMAIALSTTTAAGETPTPFRALCGFRKLEDIRLHLFQWFPDVLRLLSPSVVESLRNINDSSDEEVRREVTKSIFSNIMSHCDNNNNNNSGNDLITATITTMFQTINNNNNKDTSDHPPAMRRRVNSNNNNNSCNSNKEENEGRLLLTNVMQLLQQDFPNDIGVIMPLLLNYIELQPGECFFMGPNEPHAYISGDCAEVMALSDNVVRCGLTPKFKDTHTLLSMLHYRTGIPARIAPVIIEEIAGVVKTTLYRPPVDVCSEFELEIATITPTTTTTTVTHFRAIPAASIIIVVQGEDQQAEGNYDLVSWSTDNNNNNNASTTTSVKIGEGSVVFLPANSAARIVTTTTTTSAKSIVAIRAHINLG